MNVKGTGRIQGSGLHCHAPENLFCRFNKAQCHNKNLSTLKGSALFRVELFALLSYFKKQNPNSVLDPISKHHAHSVGVLLPQR